MTQTSPPESPARSTVHRPYTAPTYLRSARLLALAYAGISIGAVGTAVFFVAVATVLSVYKPWGKTRFAAR